MRLLFLSCIIFIVGVSCKTRQATHQESLKKTSKVYPVNFKSMSKYCDSFSFRDLQVTVNYNLFPPYHVIIKDQDGARGEFYSKDKYTADSGFTMYYSSGRRKMKGQKFPLSGFMYRYFGTYKHGYFSFYDSLGNQVKTETYRDGLLDGQAYYYANGELNSYGVFFENEKNGLWTFLDSAGSLIKEEYYHNGYLHGLYKEYYPDKKLKVKGEYSYNQKVGTWEYYDISGRLLKRETHEASVATEMIGEEEIFEFFVEESDIRINNNDSFSAYLSRVLSPHKAPFELFIIHTANSLRLAIEKKGLIQMIGDIPGTMFRINNRPRIMGRSFTCYYKVRYTLSPNLSNEE